MNTHFDIDMICIFVNGWLNNITHTVYHWILGKKKEAIKSSFVICLCCVKKSVKSVWSLTFWLLIGVWIELGVEVGFSYATIVSRCLCLVWFLLFEHVLCFDLFWVRKILREEAEYRTHANGSCMDCYYCAFSWTTK